VKGAKFWSVIRENNSMDIGRGAKFLHLRSLPRLVSLLGLIEGSYDTFSYRLSWNKN